MNLASHTLGTAFIILEVIGTIAFAVSGAMAASLAKMDWLGGVVLAIVVAIGGGTIRDLLIGQVPVSWIIHLWPVFVAFGTAVIVIAVLRWRPHADLANRNPIMLADAAGLSAFVILGANIALLAGYNAVVAVILGTISGAGGGVLRDVLTNRKPAVLVGQIYALAGIVGASLYVGLVYLGLPATLAVWLPVLSIFGLRVIAIRRNWSLPTI